jgi:RNA polymerase sigma-70 factor (ECF subfamily)
MDQSELLTAAKAGDEHAFEGLLAPYRRELRLHCYRMAGSMHEADDLLQETLLKVWKGLPSFEDRSSLRTWLYRVATNACLDVLEKRQPRVLPFDLDGPVAPGDSIGYPSEESSWLGPCPEEFYSSLAASPAAHYELQQSVSLAFLTAIQKLPARQRAVLILRDVLGFEASECAVLLEVSTASINSLLQRARETLAALAPLAPKLTMSRAAASAPTPEQLKLLTRYVQAWEGADVSALVALLVDDASLAMPPLPQWILGAQAIGASIEAMVFSPAGPGAFRLFLTEANGQPALAAYQWQPEREELLPFALHVLELRGDKIASITAFLDPEIVSLFPHRVL